MKISLGHYFSVGFCSPFSFDVNARKRSRYLTDKRVPNRLVHWGFSSQPGLRHTPVAA